MPIPLPTITETLIKGFLSNNRKDLIESNWYDFLAYCKEQGFANEESIDKHFQEFFGE